MFPDIITNNPSYIELWIFQDEVDHLPFWVDTKPSDKTIIKVIRFKNNTYTEHCVDSKYRYHFNELLQEEGIVLKGNRYIVRQ